MLYSQSSDGFKKSGLGRLRYFFGFEEISRKKDQLLFRKWEYQFQEPFPLFLSLSLITNIYEVVYIVIVTNFTALSQFYIKFMWRGE